MELISDYLLDKRHRQGILLIFLILSVSVLFSPFVKADSTVQIKAGHLRNVEDLIKLSEGVEIKQEDITLKAPKGEMQREEKKLILQEGIKMDYDQGQIESQQMTGWFNEDRFLFEKDVIFNYTSDENDKSFTLKAPYLEMNSEDNSFQAEQGVEIDYEERILKSQKAEYSEEDQLLILIEDVYIEEENGDWIKCNRAEFDLSSGEEDFTAAGEVEIEINLEEEDKE